MPPHAPASRQWSARAGGPRQHPRDERPGLLRIPAPVPAPRVLRPDRAGRDRETSTPATRTGGPHRRPFESLGGRQRLGRAAGRRAPARTSARLRRRHASVAAAPTVSTPPAMIAAAASWFPDAQTAHVRGPAVADRGQARGVESVDRLRSPGVQSEVAGVRTPSGPARTASRPRRGRGHRRPGAAIITGAAGSRSSLQAGDQHRPEAGHLQQAHLDEHGPTARITVCACRRGQTNARIAAWRDTAASRNGRPSPRL